MVPSNTVQRRMAPSKRFTVMKHGDGYAVYDTITNTTLAVYPKAAEARARRDRRNRAQR